MRLFIILSSTIRVVISLIIKISDVLPTLSYYIVISIGSKLSFMHWNFDLPFVLDLSAYLFDQLDSRLILYH